MARPTQLLLIAFGFLFACHHSAHAADAARPNFVIILCDDLGYGDLGCYGHPRIKTPHLDRLAAEGIRLTNCYASAPVCSSSRAGLLTGRTPSRVGVYDWIPPGHTVHLRGQEITIASLLQSAGYATCVTGKWHCNGHFNSPRQPQPDEHGFDHWFATQNNAAPSHADPNNFVRNGEPVGELAGYSCQVVVDEAIRWLRESREPDAPFFLYVPFHEPHEPIASPPDLVSEYASGTEEGEALYYANVANTDRAVGRLIAALDEAGLRENTLVIFTSDNGPETLNRYRGSWRSYGSPGPLRGMKLHIYEGGIRVPGIIRWPARAEAGQVLDTPISAVDFLPTLCAVAGIDPPRDRVLDGTSFLPIFEGRDIDRPRPLFWHYYRALSEPKVALRDGDWKLVAHWDGPSRPLGPNVNRASQRAMKEARLTRFELYNLRDDLGETTDLAEQEPQRLSQMSRQLEQIYAEVLAEGPTWDLPE